MKKIHFGHLLAASALAVAGCAAFFSVFGLSQLFAGASLAVIIMASSLEFSKVIAASFLHKYWGEMGKTLRTYLTVGVVVLVTITSAGIYGFLSSAYQKTAANLEVHNGQVGILEGKVAQFQSKIDANKALIESRTKRINQLNDLRNGQETRLQDRRSANATRRDIASSNGEIKDLNANIDVLNSENSKLMDSVGKYNMQKLETTSNSKVAGEVGPLKYLADLTGLPMDRVVNYFILLLVFVFDPLAIALVIGTTWIFEKKRKEGIEEPEHPYKFVGGNGDWSDLPEIVEESNFEGISPQDLEKWGITKEQEITPQLEFDFDAIPEEVVIPEIIEDEIDDSVHEDEIPEKETKPYFEPVIPTGKIERSDIREVKERERGFSVKIPDAKNTVQRIGTQKVIRNDDRNNIIFKKE